MKKLHWLEKVVICITIVFAIFSIITAFNIEDTTFIIGPIHLNVIPLMFIWMGILWVFFTILLTFISWRLSDIDERVNIQCKHEIEIGKILSEVVKNIDLAFQDPNRYPQILEVRKRLNGIRFKLTQRTIARNISEKLIETLQKNNVQEFIGVSTFSLEWWFQPEWLFYLMNQISICQRKNINAKRYAIYKLEDIRLYKEEILDFIRSHEFGAMKLIVCEHQELIEKFEEIARKLNSLTSEDQKALINFIRDYLRKSKDLPPKKESVFPDGVLMKTDKEIMCYIREPTTGYFEVIDDKEDEKAKCFQNYLFLLGEAEKVNEVLLTQKEIEKL